MAETVTFTSLKKSLSARKFAPIYLLHGEEGYYIDELVKIFEDLLSPEEKDFNQYVFYAPQVEASTVMDVCQRYPMMSDFQVVILKECQSAKSNYLNNLVSYAQNPSSTTILVLVVRGVTVKAGELTKAIQASKGIAFESKKIRDYQIGPVIDSLVKEKGLNIEPKALAMLQDYVGTDLSRIYNEVDKMYMVLGRGAMITPESIERNIGISKDFNNFELVAALARKDSAKCFRIVDYFKRSPNKNPVQATLPVVFKFFANLLNVVYLPDKSQSALMKEFGFKYPVQLTDINNGMRCYNAFQMIEIIDAIRRTDCQSKGIGSRANSHDLLEELVFTILNCRGKINL